MRQSKQMSQNRNRFVLPKTVVATHEPFEFQDYRLAHHQRLTGLDQTPCRHPLAFRFGIRLVFDVVAGKNVGVEANHRLSSVAGSRSTGTAPRRLFSMPNPLSGTPVGELLTRIST